MNEIGQDARGIEENGFFSSGPGVPIASMMLTLRCSSDESKSGADGERGARSESSRRTEMKSSEIVERTVTLHTSVGRERGAH